MRALYVLLIISAILGLIAYIPIQIQISVNADEQRAILKYAFFKMILYPPTEKKAAEKEREPKKKENKEDNNIGFDFVFGLWGKCRNEAFLFLSKFTSYLVKHGIKIYELNLSGCFGVGDPAYTGMLCGALYSAVYNFIGKLTAKGILKKHSINLTPDFDNECLKVGTYAELRMRFLHCIVLLIIALKHGLRLLKIYKKARKEYDNG